MLVRNFFLSLNVIYKHNNSHMTCQCHHWPEDRNVAFLQGKGLINSGFYGKYKYVFLQQNSCHGFQIAQAENRTY